MISAVVFDLGGVLIDWQPEPAIAHAVGTEEARAFLDDFPFRAWNHEQDRGRPWAEVEAEAIDAHPRWRSHIEAYRQNFPLSLVGQFDATVAVLRELSDHAVRLFALTNWAAETFPHARERFGWLELFDDIVVSGEVNLAKPDPAIFAVLAGRTGLAPEQLFFVDDSQANVDAARRAGLHAVRFVDAATLRADLVSAGVL